MIKCDVDLNSFPCHFWFNEGSLGNNISGQYDQLNYTFLMKSETKCIIYD